MKEEEAPSCPALTHLQTWPGPSSARPLPLGPSSRGLRAARRAGAKAPDARALPPGQQRFSSRLLSPPSFFAADVNKTSSKRQQLFLMYKHEWLAKRGSPPHSSIRKIKLRKLKFPRHKTGWFCFLGTHSVRVKLQVKLLGSSTSILADSLLAEEHKKLQKTSLKNHKPV